MVLNGEVRPLELENPNGLRILVREQGTTITIEMAGEWDLAARDAARHAIARALAGQPKSVLLDLSRLEFIDSSGLHGTIELARRSAEQNVRLVIIPGDRAVQRVFEIAGLLDHLPFIDEQPAGSTGAAAAEPEDGAAGSGASLHPPARPTAARRRRASTRTPSVQPNLTRS